MIREMKSNEIPECVQLIRESFMTVAREFDITQENAPRFTAFAVSEERLQWQYESEGRPMYVYCEDDRIVGFYSLLVKGDECELNNLCVLPTCRHKGIGAQLLSDCFARASALGCSKLEIGIVEDNTRLRKWYESHGFVHKGTHKFSFFPFTCGYLERAL